MSHTIRVILLLTFLLVLIADPVLAMSSTNFSLDWFELLTGSGGSRLTSPHYAGYVTLGQTGQSSMTSPSYRSAFGYWAGVTDWWRVLIPAAMR